MKERGSSSWKEKRERKRERDKERLTNHFLASCRGNLIVRSAEGERERKRERERERKKEKKMKIFDDFCERETIDLKTFFLLKARNPPTEEGRKKIRSFARPLLNIFLLLLLRA